MTAIGVGLSAAGQAAGFMGQQKATDDYNAVAKQNAINASVAATQQYTDEGRRLSHDAKATNQEGFDAIMKARQARGMAVASTGSAGMDLGSVSVDSILSDLHTQEANSEYAIADRHASAEEGYDSRTKSYEAQAQGRINSMPFKEGPSPLGLALGIATDTFGAVAKSPKGKAWFGG